MERRRKDGILPKSFLEKLFLLVVLIFIFTAFAVEGYIILPRICDYEEDCQTSQIYIGSLIMFNFLASMWKFMAVDTGANIDDLPAMLLPGWRRCLMCRANFPPRSSHCHRCKKCVLVRNNHSFFGGTCIGYHNRRYYLMMLLYFWIGLFNANILNYYCLSELYETIEELIWFYGNEEEIALLLSWYSATCALCFLCVSYAFFTAMKRAMTGRTTSEINKHRGFQYDRGFIQNMEEAFGKRWMACWISPFIRSPLPGDGLHFI